MPLTHVCIWDPQVGYRRITVDEACRLYPYGVSASSGHFVCELCAQNVLLTAPGANIRHFRHDPASPNKECDERQASFDPTYGRRRLQSFNSHAMPLRIAVRGNGFVLQLGFFWPPDARARCEKIKIAGESGQLYEYSFERIEHTGTTYLDVGGVPSKRYQLDYINANNELNRYWAGEAQGVPSRGAFFDGGSGRMIQLGGRAYSGNAYYLLQRGMLYGGECRDIEADQIACVQAGAASPWYLYRIRVRQFSENAAKFFLKRSIFLTEKPTKFYPLWPPYVKDSYYIYHNNSEFYFYLCGDDAELKAYPATAEASAVQDGRLYKLYTGGREQLVSLGKSGALGFSYLIKGPLNKKAPLPPVTVSDQSGIELEGETCSRLPKGKLISVSCRYDGKAVVRRRGKIDHVYRLCGGQDLILDGLLMDMEIEFYQGLDRVRTIRFQQKKTGGDAMAEDQALVKRLNACGGPMVPVSHAAGAMAGKYASHPRTRQWLYRALRQGKISREALRLLEDNIPNKGGRAGDDRD